MKTVMAISTTLIVGLVLGGAAAAATKPVGAYMLRPSAGWRVVSLPGRAHYPCGPTFCERTLGREAGMVAHMGGIQVSEAIHKARTLAAAKAYWRLHLIPPRSVPPPRRVRLASWGDASSSWVVFGGPVTKTEIWYQTTVQYGLFDVDLGYVALTHNGALAAAVSWVDRALERVPWFGKCPAHRDCTHAQIAGVRG